MNAFSVLTVAILAFCFNYSLGQEGMSITLKHVSNPNLCVRTEAFEWEGAIMRLSGCEREYPFYDGNKVFWTAGDGNSSSGEEVTTMWAPSQDAFGVNGCIYADATAHNLRAKYCDTNSTMGLWRIEESRNGTALWRNQETDLCAAVPAVQDGTDLTLAPCNSQDLLQQWIVEHANLVIFR